MPSRSAPARQSSSRFVVVANDGRCDDARAIHAVIEIGRLPRQPPCRAAAPTPSAPAAR
jgi:hypothetical protein